MTDWKQITARIRRARTSKDPAGQLSNLYQKTRDAMVAFELAKFFETSGQNADAAKWYSAAAERFRRSDWKVKAQEAAVRLGGAPGEIPLAAGAPPTPEFALTPPAVSTPEPGLPFDQNPEALESSVAVTSEIQQAAESSVDTPASAEPERKGRRRGRRGGRNRRKSNNGKEAAVAPGEHAREAPAPRRGLPPAVFEESAEPTPPRVTHSRTIPSFADRADWGAGRSEREGTLRRSRALFANFLAGNAIPQTDDLPARQTGRSGSRAGRTGCICPVGYVPDGLLFRGGLPDAAHRHRQLVARRQPPRSGFDQATARARLLKS